MRTDQEFLGAQNRSALTRLFDDCAPRKRVHLSLADITPYQNEAQPGWS